MTLKEPYNVIPMLARASSFAVPVQHGRMTKNLGEQIVIFDQTWLKWPEDRHEFKAGLG